MPPRRVMPLQSGKAGSVALAGFDFALRSDTIEEDVA